jgi:hypothetical protein
VPSLPQMNAGGTVVSSSNTGSHTMRWVYFHTIVQDAICGASVTVSAPIKMRIPTTASSHPHYVPTLLSLYWSYHHHHHHNINLPLREKRGVYKIDRRTFFCTNRRSLRPVLLRTINWGEPLPPFFKKIIESQYPCERVDSGPYKSNAAPSNTPSC